ncbi:MAG: BadF/BadG/BcrA/BcrD ATPase family protein [Planctomycetota bacterium]
MRYCVGIDLGSTTTKAVVLDEEGGILGRGITNSRSNYNVACKVALGEALINTRFSMVASELSRAGVEDSRRRSLMTLLDCAFREQQYLQQLHLLARVIHGLLDKQGKPKDICQAVDEILEEMRAESHGLYQEGGNRKSDFFRDLAGGRYLHLAEARAKTVDFDQLVGLYDKAILEVENTPPGEDDFGVHAIGVLRSLTEPAPELKDAVECAARTELLKVSSVGTGYGRQRLPFPKAQIRSEILCHGLGAHTMFPDTRTVLDIGGQDTKAIQVDEQGIVTSFQMNDRCAAGCGRYLGYIADEMNLGLHELGPLAEESTRPARINSTCTVFAGAELRERLSLGERREDILAGLHRAIILRAMSLLARSGGVKDEFTFTGGVAKNPAAVEALQQLVIDNYGDLVLNISPDSIYTGALGAALFACRDRLKLSA